MSTADLDPAVVVRRAVDLLHKATDALDGHRDTEPLRDALGWVIDELTDQFADPLDTPAVLAVATVLVGTAELAAYTDEQARPVVQRILDGELGQDAAPAMTRVVLDLAHARGQVKALERELRADRAPWPVVDTSPDTQADISSPEIPAAGGERS